MKQKTLYPVWGIVYILCCTLGFLPQRTTALNVVLTVISVLFFLPGVLILADSYKHKDHKGLVRLRLISLASLLLSLILLVASFISTQGSTALGDALHFLLGVVSVPMFCSSFWALSLFLWACLFIASFPKVIGK